MVRLKCFLCFLLLCTSAVSQERIWNYRPYNVQHVRQTQQRELHEMPTKHRWISTDGSMKTPGSWASGEAPATKAVGVLTFTVLPAINDTVLIDFKTYRFVASLAATNDVLRGADFTDSRDNLVAAITLGGADPNVENTTVIHTTVTAVAESTDKLNATAILRGTDGNSLDTTVPIGSGCSWGAATLAGATMWDTDDEIIVGSEATQDFISDLDWGGSFCSPTLEIRRMNVDRTNINFGAPGNNLKFKIGNASTFGGLNYLGTGLMYGDFTTLKRLYVDSLTSQTVMIIRGAGSPGLRNCIIESGDVLLTINVSADEIAGEGYVFTTGHDAVLRIEGDNFTGWNLVCAVRGRIENARAVDGAFKSGLIVAPDGTLIQTGYMLDGPTTFNLNLGGVFSYEPVIDPQAVSQNMFAMAGITRFDNSSFSIINMSKFFKGADANVFRGGSDFTGLAAERDVDLSDDFPF